MSQCSDLVPKFAGGPGVPLDDNELGECLLREDHRGGHLVKTPGGYYRWRPQESYCWDDDDGICDCDFVECYIYQHISDAQAKKLLAKDGAGTD